MRCPNCGTENEDGVRFCKGCGSEMRTPAGNRGASPNYSTQAPLPTVDSGEDYTPISMWVVLCQDLVQVKMRNFSPF